MTPAKRHGPQACPLSNLCLSGTGRTKPALPIIPPELSAGPTWASPPGFQASSTLPQGQRAPWEARGPGTHRGPRRVPVVRATQGLSSRQIQPLVVGNGERGGPNPSLPRAGLSPTLRLFGAPGSPLLWAEPGRQTGGWGGAGRRSGSSRWMRPNSLLGSLPACDASLPRSRDRSSPLQAQFTVAPRGLGLPLGIDTSDSEQTPHTWGLGPRPD